MIDKVVDNIRLAHSSFDFEKVKNSKSFYNRFKMILINIPNLIKASCLGAVSFELFGYSSEYLSKLTLGNTNTLLHPSIAVLSGGLSGLVHGSLHCTWEVGSKFMYAKQSTT